MHATGTSVHSALIKAVVGEEYKAVSSMQLECNNTFALFTIERTDFFCLPVKECLHLKLLIEPYENLATDFICLCSTIPIYATSI